MSTPAVTAACLGGACELCPRQSNTGKACSCSCHGTPITSASADHDTPAGRKSVTSLCRGDRVRLITRGTVVAVIVPSDTQRDRRSATPAVVQSVRREGYFRVVVTNVGATTPLSPQVMAQTYTISPAENGYR